MIHNQVWKKAVSAAVSLLHKQLKAMSAKIEQSSEIHLYVH